MSQKSWLLPLIHFNGIDWWISHLRIGRYLPLMVDCWTFWTLIWRWTLVLFLHPLLTPHLPIEVATWGQGFEWLVCLPPTKGYFISFHPFLFILMSITGPKPKPIRIRRDLNYSRSPLCLQPTQYLINLMQVLVTFEKGEKIKTYYHS
jgi:hypothetical protein